MNQIGKRLKDTFPEINELIALKDFLVSLISKKDSEAKHNIANFLKTFINTLKFILRDLLPQIQSGLLLWGMIYGLGKSLSYFLNPLGIEKYF